MSTTERNGYSKLKQKLPTLASWDNGIKMDVVVFEHFDPSFLRHLVIKKPVFKFIRRRLVTESPWIYYQTISIPSKVIFANDGKRNIGFE